MKCSKVSDNSERLDYNQLPELCGSKSTLFS